MRRADQDCREKQARELLIPIDLCERANIHPGSEVELEFDGADLWIRAVSRGPDLDYRDATVAIPRQLYEMAGLDSGTESTLELVDSRLRVRPRAPLPREGRQEQQATMRETEEIELTTDELMELTRGVPRCDFMTFIRATPEKLWAALTRGEFTLPLGGGQLESEWCGGSTVAYRDGEGRLATVGEVLLGVPPRHLSYTWRIDMNAHPFERPSRVTFDLEPLGTLVKLKMKHNNLVDETCQDSFTVSWAAALSSFKSFLETGDPLVFERSLHHA